MLARHMDVSFLQSVLPGGTPTGGICSCGERYLTLLAGSPSSKFQLLTTTYSLGAALRYSITRSALLLPLRLLWAAWGRAS